MTQVSLDRIAQAFGMNESKPQDFHQYATVDSVNLDGSYQVQLNGSLVTTRAAKLCNAEIGDRVLCVVQDGDVAAIGKVGGEFSGIGTYKEDSQLDNVSVSSGSSKSLCHVDLEKGTWIITGTASWNTNSSGIRALFISTSQDTVPDDSGLFKALQQVGAASGSYTWLSLTCIVRPTATTTYYLTTQQTSGTSLNCRGEIHAVKICGNLVGGGGNINLQSKTVTSSFTQQTVTPDNGYDALSSVTVNAMPYTTESNASGGLTVTIG